MFWTTFFKELGFNTILSSKSNKKILKDGINISNDEACLALKMYLGHIIDLKDKCDYILVPRMYSIKKNEQVCTNFNCLYDLVNNLFDLNILNYNIDLTKRISKLIAFLELGETLGISYIQSYKAFKEAEKAALEERTKKEENQRKLLESNNLKILLAGHPYNLYDELIGKTISDFLSQNNISIFYSDRIDHTIIDQECHKLSTDIHWTHSKEVVASINYYQDKVDGIIIISSFPCGPDSLSNELVTRKIKNIPIITLIFEDLNSEAGIITRLESFIDILERRNLCQK
ncbi:MAG: acyl-CoA dehydratase activase-related protein [Tenericutes bacterium]|nr:acyl-CoA dehydratase activase-related protein [Mycoplasmatota bacterium]